MPGFLTLSLLLHLLLLFLLPQRSLFPTPAPKPPVYVEVRPPKALDRELDLPPKPEPERPRETPAKRLGPNDQVVEKETAPKGGDTEDRIPSAALRPQVPPPPRPETRPKPKPKATPEARTPVAERPTPTGPERSLEETKPNPAPRELPDLKTLTQLAPQTIARLEDEWRRKYREDVAEGNAVWLDTEKDILISFFQRFRDNIYGVWHYPRRSVDKGEEGTCLLRISVNRDGSLNNVKLMETSGYPALDNEAMAAVRKASPYGPLPRAYKGDILNIFAFFKYNLSRRLIY